MQPSSIVRVLVLCLTALPACFLGILILKFSVDVPFWDQWDIAHFFEKVSRGSLSFGDLFAQQNEYRQFFPYIIFVALGWLTGWDVRYEMVFSFFLACVVAFNIFRLGEITLGGRQVPRLLIFLLSNLIVLSPMQHDNWLFGIQVVYFMPIACITTCMLVAYTELGAKTKFLICMCLSTISTFSSANGLLCWVLIPPILVLSNSQHELMRKKWLQLGWMVGFTLNVLLYFYDYRKPLHHPSLDEALIHPMQAIYYFIVFLGTPLGVGRHPLLMAKVVGMVLTLAYVLSCIYSLKFSSDHAFARRTICWLMLGAYSVITAVMVTFGRLGFGVEQALSTRYTTFSLYLVVALVYLLPIIIEDIINRGHFTINRFVLDQLISLTAVALIILHLLMLVPVTRQMRESRRVFLQAKASLLFINFVEDESLTERLFPNLPLLKEQANSLNSLGYLRPGLIQSNRIQDIQGISHSVAKDYGSFDGLSNTGHNTYLASGWAILPDRKEPADAVLLTYEKDSDDSVVFELIHTATERELAARREKFTARSVLRWQKSFTLDKLPTNPATVSAWAFDANTGKAFKIDGVHVIQRAE
ncbi:MAG: hypothetical protein M3458_03305 [Acidobacteriota bacterium]|nr:hypothetical protein [Acidobacteriota bacterium]